jgi:hypothetical protein
VLTNRIGWAYNDNLVRSEIAGPKDKFSSVKS